MKDLKPLSGKIEMDETMFGGKRPCNYTLPAIPKQVVSNIPMTGLPIPSYLFGGIMWLY